MTANELRLGNYFKWTSTQEIDRVRDIKTSQLRYTTINNVNISD